MRYIVEKDCTSEGDGSGNPVKVIKPQKSDTHIEFYDDGSGDGSAEETQRSETEKDSDDSENKKQDSTNEQLILAEHQKKGTTNPANRNKHEKGKARKNRDNGGEKGDTNRTRYRLNHSYSADTQLGVKIAVCFVIVVGILSILVLIADDAVGGFADDAAIPPIIILIRTAMQAL